MGDDATDDMPADLAHLKPVHAAQTSVRSINGGADRSLEPLPGSSDYLSKSIDVICHVRPFVDLAICCVGNLFGTAFDLDYPDGRPNGQFARYESTGDLV